MEPETHTMQGGKVVKLRVAVNYAGSEKDADNKSGYFDVVYYAREADFNGKWLLSQLDDKKMKVGSQIQMIYRLEQQRWKNPEGNMNQKVVLVAEAITYAGSAPSTETAEKEVALPDSF